MSSVQKILDELHHSRIQLENDKKAGEKAKAEYAEINTKICTLKEQRKICANKLEETYKSIAVRTVDVNLYAKKLEIVKSEIEELKDINDSLSHQLTNFREQYSTLAENLLQISIKFAGSWNCTERGYEQRKLSRKNDMDSLKAKKAQLLIDLDDFLTKQKEIEALHMEMQEMEEKFQQREAIVSNKEKELYEEMDKASGALSSLLAKREGIVQRRRAELDKILMQIENRKDRVSKLELRAANAHSTIDNQKRARSHWSLRNTDSNTQVFRKEHTNVSRIYQPIKPTQQQINTSGITFTVIPTNDEENKIPECNTMSQTSQKNKATRIFHFKKRPASTETDNQANDFVSGRAMYQNKCGQGQ